MTVSERLKVLFVCAMNRQRSVTAERLYCRDPRLEVRSAGVWAEALRRVSEADVKWADVVFVMEREHKRWITTHFQHLELPPIEVLDIPDEYECMDPHLQEILRMTLEPEFEARRGRMGSE
jgi:predicted protein tyrosine phosphatase